MVIYLSLLVCLLGGVIYLVCNGPAPSSPKFAELGRIMFGVGLFVFLLRFSGPLLQVIK
jgi:hypothetical protein